jgi:glycosyltransferase involved in cell wall biosynthesis
LEEGIGIQDHIGPLTIVATRTAQERVLQPNARSSFHDSCLVVIPALNEEATIATVVEGLRRRGFRRIRVIDNGSSDATASRAVSAGADVLTEARCGYGRACLRGLTKLPRGVAWILFCDADGSDNLDDVDSMIDAARQGADLVLSNRYVTKSGREAMTFIQRLGNRLVSRLVEYGWGFRFADFGPLRLIRRQALEDINMRERGFGWNVVMQIRALEAGLKIWEVPVRYRPRQGGKSKISGNLFAAVCAGFGILQAVARLYLAPRRSGSAGGAPALRQRRSGSI